ncbi:translation elongation factor Ts [Promineifilum sp.]|uniref:translation elongation factor Ts n=1 Tax=Promineifilum sp. TaxID=2664178 RepID=UPI0035B4C0F0
MAITAEMVKELRGVTGAGVLEAKKALEQTEGDFNKAVDILREKGAARALKRADRAAKEGMIELYTHPGNRIGVMLELNCETDFVARTEQFRELAHNLALHIVSAAPRYIRREEVTTAELDREMAVLKAQAIAEGKPEAIAEKMVAGRISKFYEEFCLLEQPFAKDEKVKIKDMLADAIRTTGENIIVRRFARYELGESLED